MSCAGSLYFPDRIQGVAELNQHSGGAHQKRDEADHGGDHSVRGVARALQKCRESLSGGGPDERLHLLDRIALSGGAAKDHADDRNHKQKQGRERQQRIEG
jgi:hypothetical protein